MKICCDTVCGEREGTGKESNAYKTSASGASRDLVHAFLPAPAARMGAYPGAMPFLPSARIVLMEVGVCWSHSHSWLVQAAAKSKVVLWWHRRGAAQ